MGVGPTATVEEATAEAGPGRGGGGRGGRRRSSAWTSMTAAMEVLRSIWGFEDGKAPISAELLRALSFAGGYVAGAFADGASSARRPGSSADRDGAAHLHSHISGVVSGVAGPARRPGAQAAPAGVGDGARHPVIEWTFDPLVRRNAYFNLVKLGAEIVGYEPNFYGEMHDAINAGDLTDRAVVHWEVASHAPPVAETDGRVILRPGRRRPSRRRRRDLRRAGVAGVGARGRGGPSPAGRQRRAGRGGPRCATRSARRSPPDTSPRR